jgi:hypothetical protein
MWVASAIDTRTADHYLELLGRSFCLFCLEFASVMNHGAGVAVVLCSVIALYRQGYVDQTTRMSNRHYQSRKW